MEPTTACNLGCPECPSGLKKFSRPTGKMDVVQHEQWLKELSRTVFYITYYFQGEPFLNPKFLLLIEAAKRGDVNKVWVATSALVEAKKKLKSKTPQLIFQCLAVKPNEHEISSVFEKAKELGVDEVRIKSAQLYDYEFGNPLMPENEQYSRYRLNRKGTFELKQPGGNHCWRMWSGSVITWDGQVVPCCFDKDASHAMGALTKETFRQVWNNPKYKKFRNAVLTNRQGIDICQNCSEGSKVWL